MPKGQNFKRQSDKMSNCALCQKAKYHNRQNEYYRTEFRIGLNVKGTKCLNYFVNIEFISSEGRNLKLFTCLFMLLYTV
jgi:hypothetical protein